MMPKGTAHSAASATSPRPPPRATQRRSPMAAPTTIPSRDDQRVGTDRHRAELPHPLPGAGDEGEPCRHGQATIAGVRTPTATPEAAGAAEPPDAEARIWLLKASTVVSLGGIDLLAVEEERRRAGDAARRSLGVAEGRPGGVGLRLHARLKGVQLGTGEASLLAERLQLLDGVAGTLLRGLVGEHDVVVLLRDAGVHGTAEGRGGLGGRGVVELGVEEVHRVVDDLHLTGGDHLVQGCAHRVSNCLQAGHWKSS